MSKPQCTDVHEDFRIKRNAEITLLSSLPFSIKPQLDSTVIAVAGRKTGPRLYSGTALQFISP